MKRSVFFYVQHLWGVGHVYRATRIAHGLKNEGFDVHLVWGGTKIPGFDFSGLEVHYLTPVRTSDVSFSQLLHDDYRVFTDDDKQERREQLLNLFDQIKPDILITEAFPFGRRQMLFELKPLLEKARQLKKPPVIVASIRDIMQEGRKQKRVDESVRFVNEIYDIVLVHGDPNLIRIEETLQGTEHFSNKIKYTGLVTPDPQSIEPSKDFACDVLVTVGGGAFGQNLTRTAVQAMQHSKKFPANWIVSAGSELPEDEFHDLVDFAPQGMRVVRFIPGLAGAMRECKVSVSHAGYNTVADILRSGCKSVLYPYADGNETEQLRRSKMMAEQGIAVHLSPDDLSPESLAEAIDRAADLPPAEISIDLNGSTNTAHILSEYCNEKQSP